MNECLLVSTGPSLPGWTSEPLLRDNESIIWVKTQMTFLVLLIIVWVTKEKAWPSTPRIWQEYLGLESHVALSKLLPTFECFLICGMGQYQPMGCEGPTQWWRRYSFKVTKPIQKFLFSFLLWAQGVVGLWGATEPQFFHFLPLGRALTPMVFPLWCISESSGSLRIWREAWPVYVCQVLQVSPTLSKGREYSCA